MKVLRTDGAVTQVLSLRSGKREWVVTLDLEATWKRMGAPHTPISREGFNLAEAEDN